MGKFQDLTGQRFGRLVVVKRLENNSHNQARWLVKCDCGNTVSISASQLKNGTKSCGCLRKEVVSKEKTKDLTGQTFGRLTVIERVGSSKNQKSLFLCKCSCGKTKVILGSSLTSKRVTSCGCLAKEEISKRTKTHGKTNTRLHSIWNCMKTRCYNANSKSYQYYGAKGVTICEEWLKDFKAFYDWSMSHGYKENLTIDRINPFGNYEPSNCRWITMQEQRLNKRNSECNKKYKEEYFKKKNKPC